MFSETANVKDVPLYEEREGISYLVSTLYGLANNLHFAI